MGQASETAGQQRSDTEARWKSGAAVLTVAVVVVYVALSAGQIMFNKYLMDDERFPFAVVLVMIHMLATTAFNSGLFLLRPQLFPALSSERWAAAKQDGLLIYKITGICVLFSGVLVLSNSAYIKSSVPFLQMMKESNLVLVYLVSLVAAIEPLQGSRILVVTLMIAATTLTVKGEIHFSLQGFLLQGSSQLMESIRVVLQGLVLRGSGLKLDALSYVLITSPISFALLSGAFIGEKILGASDLMPARTSWGRWWPMLLANACVAVGLNISVAFAGQRITPMQLITVGVVKDCLVVLLSAFVAHESVSPMQVVGFSAQITLVFTWNYFFKSPPPPGSGEAGGKQPGDAGDQLATSIGKEGYGTTRGGDAAAAPKVPRSMA